MSSYLWQDRDQREYAYPFNPRPDGLALIRREPTVALDIGCGSGGVGHALRERFPACQRWGCELDPKAAQLARQHFDHVVEQNVESVDFAALGLSQPFDLVCLFDVLEHLVNPWQLLHELRARVTADAQVLVSLPNVSNLLLLHDALQGHWRYRNWGLLDFTHLRFFSDFDARRMFYQTGYRVLDHRANLFGQGAGIYQQYSDQPFPLALSVGDITLKVQSQAHLRQLCTDQNLYLISPHHGQFADAQERELALGDYPPVYAFGGD